MRKIFLLTGFQNWGKTWLIQEAFKKERFAKSALHSFSGHLFCVMPQSNDDLGKEGYESAYHERMKALKTADITPKYIFSAFCPTKEPDNVSADIIVNIYAKDQVVIIPIEYKWCCHARLQIEELEKYYSGLKNVRIISLSQKNPALKIKELTAIVTKLLP